MEWISITSDGTRHICEAQKHLFNKYVPGEKLTYIDVEDMSTDTWTTNVLGKLGGLPEYVVFGLDDFLPYEPINMVWFNLALGACKANNLQRFELGHGASKKGKDKYINRGAFLEYKKDCPYIVSTQFSIWNSQTLKELLSIPKSPWDFEMTSKLDRVWCYHSECLRYIEQGSVSRRKPGKINLQGMGEEDEFELVRMEYVDPANIVYSWK